MRARLWGIAVLGLALHGAAPAQMVSPADVQRTLEDLERYYKAYPERRPGNKLAPEPVPMQPPATCAGAVYPADAMRMGWQGSVKIKFLVGESGKVLDAVVMRSSTFPLLDESGLTAIRACQFAPILHNGKPVERWGSIVYDWSLK